ncbi:MAG: peptide chain release factor aRF-1 [Candidatus Diapherotrites archaeon]|uniref:Peptide chain release factor subunit 1 n=1 Tax=Candidatus Iainarchaeum sp. TaxID=3101447 RepID=A0A8T4L2N9_9ARCH|nr:peptide chain release factor aRF-1 [Candidatus Diapherotrites archaeon]
MALKLEEVTESERIIFNKKLAKLAKFKGRGTELISVYIPLGTDRGTVMGQLSEEISQSSNIKSPATRKNVQGALRKITSFLKQIDFKIPKNGLVVFAGNISEQEGKSDIRLFTIKPPLELKTKLYWCDSEFHLAPLKEMGEHKDVYALITIDKNEATIAVLIGKKYEIAGSFTSGVAGKSRAGGQSAKRFEHLREEAAQEFYKRISEKLNDVFLPYEDKLKGVIVGGPGVTKNYFLEKDLVDHRLKKKILGQIDTSYTDDSGIRELIQRSETLLKDTAMMKERMLVNKFLEEIARTGLAVFGEREVNEALEIGKVATLLLSEEIGWGVFRFHCEQCGSFREIVSKSLSFNPGREKCIKCGSPQLETVEEIDYLDFMLEKAQQTGAEVEIISTETQEGMQFYRAFGGIGAMLRFK